MKTVSLTKIQVISETLNELVRLESVENQALQHNQSMLPACFVPFVNQTLGDRILVA